MTPRLRLFLLVALAVGLWFARDRLMPSDVVEADVKGARAPQRLRNAAAGSECVRLSPPLPASRNLRPTEGMASYPCTWRPAAASCWAAIRPAGPPPMTTVSCECTESFRPCCNFEILPYRISL